MTRLAASAASAFAWSRTNVRDPIAVAASAPLRSLALGGGDDGCSASGCSFSEDCSDGRGAVDRARPPPIPRGITVAGQRPGIAPDFAPGARDGLVRLRLDELQQLGLRERQAVPGGHGGGVRPQRRRARDRVLRRLARAERARPHRRRRPARAAALPVRARRPRGRSRDARAGRPHAGDAAGRRDMGRLRHRARATADEPRRARLRRPRADGPGGRRHVPPGRARGEQSPARRACRPSGGRDRLGRPIATPGEARAILRVRPYAAAAETARP